MNRRLDQRQTDAELETVPVVIEVPLGPHNAYTFDSKRQTIRLAESREAEPAAAEQGFIEEGGERLDVLVLSRYPTFPGCLVEAKVIGGFEQDADVIILATPAVDKEAPSLVSEVPPERLHGLTCLAREMGLGEASMLSAEAARAFVKEWRQNIRVAAAYKRNVRSGAAWRVERPSSGAGPHTEPENLLPLIPLRFQNYVAELMFDDERILYFLERPSFRPSGGYLQRLTSRKEHDGLLLVTDRMFLFLEDAIPPGSTLVHWGYRAYVAAVERIRRSEVVEEGNAARLKITLAGSRAEDDLTIQFPASHGAELAEVLPLLKAFATPSPGLMRRLYEEPPNWTLRSAGQTTMGVAAGESGQEAIEARSDAETVSLEGGRIRWCDGKRERARVAVGEVSCVVFLKSLTGCRLVLRTGENRGSPGLTVAFNYPQAEEFLRLVSYLRHEQGRPFKPQEPNG